MKSAVGLLLKFQQLGLLGIILLLGLVLTLKAGSHPDPQSGQIINNFLNLNTLVQIATDTSTFAIMAIGMTMVIISGGIDLSVGSTYALCGVLTGILLRSMPGAGPTQLVLSALALSVGLGLVCGILNGAMVAKLGVHPFIITLGTMWVFRGIAAVTTEAQSVGYPDALINTAKATLGMKPGLYPLPTIVMIVVTVLGALYLQQTTMGRRIFAVGGNVQASKYAGLPIGPILTGVYVISGLVAGIAAFMGCSYYGSASSNDANGYELYVVASAVVGGASLNGGKGSAIGALLGSLLIVMIRQAMRTLNVNTNYEWIIIGIAIICAVVLDRASSRFQEAQLRTAP